MKNTILNDGKLFLILLLTVFIIGKSSGLEKDQKALAFYSYTPDGRTEYQLSHQKVLVKFKEHVSIADQSNIVARYRMLKSFNRDMALPSPKVSILEIADTTISAEKILEMLKSLNQDERIVYANPFLVFKDGTQQGIQNKIAVQLKTEGDLGILQREAKKMQLEIVSNYAYDKKLYFLETSKSSPGNALDVANILAESGKFQFAEPDFLLLLKKFNTNDPFLGHQWSLNNTGSSIQFNGTAGCDMKIFNAWQTSTGSSNIRIAIIDEGVDLVHPDLLANMVSGFDGTQQNSGGAPQGNDAHGTACAGIVAAVANNNVGVAGISYNSKIVPIRIAYSSGTSWVTSNSWIGTSLDWAWNQGAADVLSNSWGGGSSSSLINDPISRAVTQGRGGKGAPVLFAAGNSNSAVSYPATLSNVISVVAMSMCNQRKNPSSCDGETWWGSNFGTSADVAAPGVKIYTTDISGSAGYSTGNYAPTFNGTSSACPNAAGVMALILSVNPNLSMTQARQILESTCDKVGGYTYTSNVSGQPNGTWSTDLGYGRVNAQAALQQANPTACVNPPAVASTNASPASICVASSVTLSISGINFGSGQTYQWQSSSNNVTYTNISGATGTSHIANNVSSSTWYRCLVTCGASTPSTPVQVVYTDPTINSYPHTQNFDGGTGLPCGWTISNVNADASTWNVGTTNSRSAPNNITYNYNASSAANDWLFSPPLQLTAGATYRVSFWYRARSASFPEKLEIKWGNAATEAGMTSSTIFSNTNIINTTYTEGLSSNITPASNGIYYVGFRAFSNADMYDLHVDDVTISLVTTCSTPLLGGSITGNTTLTAGQTASYTLTGNTGNAIQWEQSTDNGASWNNISAANSSSFTSSFNPGTFQLRARSSQTSSSCSDVFSNVLTITVSPRTGDNFNIPIVANLPYNSTISTSAGSGFTSTYTGTNQQNSPDIFFRFTTGPCTDSVRITTCASNFDTYLHLLSATGTWIMSNDDNGPGCVSSRASINYAVQPNTTYFIVAEGYGANTGNLSIGITEVDSPFLLANISPGGPTTFCQGGSVTLSLNGYSSVLWNNGSTGSQITVSNSGNFSAIVTTASGCSANSNTVSVVVNPNPSVSISPAGTTNICSNSSATFLASGANSYTWNNGSSSASVQVNTAGTYTVTGTNANGCTGTASVVLTVSTASIYYADNDGDGFGNPAASTNACSQPIGFVSNNSDCNDNDSALNTLITFYVDADGDGFGSGQTAQFCSLTPPTGYANNNTDCNDSQSLIFPGATEQCGNGIDDDCDGQIDENCCFMTLSTNKTDASCSDTANGSAGVIVSNANMPITYLWSNNATTSSISGLSPGTYTVEVRDAFNCSQTASVTINSQGIAPAMPTAISGPVSVCRSTSGNFFFVPSVPGATSYVWTLPSGASGSSNSTFISVNINSTYVTGNICVRAVNACGQSAVFCRQLTAITTIPSAPGNISGNITGVCSNSVQTYSVAPITGATSYTWTVPANASIISGSGTNSINVQFGNWGASGNISVRGANCRGQGASKTIVVYNVPPLPGTINGPTVGVCGGSVQNYSIIAMPSASSYVWTVPTGCSILSGQGTVSLTVGFPSGFVTGNVTVRGVSACGQGSVRTLTIRSTPAQPASITGTSSNLCGGGTFTYSIPAVPGANSYTWSIPANCSISTNNGSSITVTYTSAFTAGNICVTANNACGMSVSRCLSVSRLPATPVSISGSASACLGTTQTYSTAQIGTLTYSWTVPSGASIVSGQGTNSIVVLWGNTAGNISIRANNACGQSGSRNLAVSLNPCRISQELIPEELQTTATDLLSDDSEDIFMHIYPVPFEDAFYLTFTGKENEVAGITMYDMTGKAILSRQMNANTIHMIEPEAAPGIYLIEITDEMGRRITKRIIKN